MNINEILNTVIRGDSLSVIKSFPDESIDCVITSPPYYQLRNYGWDGQWGLEPTYQEYLDKMIDLMSELKRVLKPEGTMWINLGDTYSANNYGSGGISKKQISNVGSRFISQKVCNDIPKNSLMLIPHRFAIRCIDELGLILRNDIIWAKPNGMPESVTNRFSKKHEFIFFFVKQTKYYFDLDSIREKPKTGYDYVYKVSSNYKKVLSNSKNNLSPIKNNVNGKNPGDVSDFWSIIVKPSKEKHYATYNTELIDKPIIAGCPEGGIILDPFCGIGTTLVRAIQLNRKAIGIEGNPEYVEIANKKIQEELNQLKLFAV